VYIHTIYRGQQYDAFNSSMHACAHPTICISKRHPQYVGMLSPMNALHALMACRAHAVWNKAGYHQDTWRHIWQSLLSQAAPHLCLQRPNLVKDVNHLWGKTNRCQGVEREAWVQMSV
jgi:hypothetical protein